MFIYVHKSIQIYIYIYKIYIYIHVHSQINTPAYYICKCICMNTHTHTTMPISEQQIVSHCFSAFTLTAHARHRHCNNAVTNIRQIQINILVLVSILKSALQSCCIVRSIASRLWRMFKPVGEAASRYTHSRSI